MKEYIISLLCMGIGLSLFHSFVYFIVWTFEGTEEDRLNEHLRIVKLEHDKELQQIFNKLERLGVMKQVITHEFEPNRNIGKCKQSWEYVSDEDIIKNVLERRKREGEQWKN